MPNLKFLLTFLSFGQGDNPTNATQLNALECQENMTREISIQKKLDDVTTHFKFLINLINEKNSSKKLKKHNKKLMKLFKEIRRNYAFWEERRNMYYRGALLPSYLDGYEDIRNEIWVNPITGERSNIITDIILYTATKKISKLYHSEINTVFNTSYIHVHEILFTQYCIHNFDKIALQMLNEFRVLLSSKSIEIPMKRFSQYMNINQLAIQNRRHPEIYVAFLFRKTIAMTWEMFSIIVDQCNEFLMENIATTDGNSFDDLDNSHIREFLRPILDWLLFLMKNPEVLKSSCTEYLIPGTEDYWDRLATFVNTLNKLKGHYSIPIATLMVEGEDMPDYMGLLNKILRFGVNFAKHSPPIFKLCRKKNGYEEFYSAIKKSLYTCNENEVKCRTEIEIKPHYIVIDTSCFIFSFSDVHKLITNFTNTTDHSCVIIIPTIVLHELKKEISSAAKLALTLLNDIESDAIKFVTTDGSVYESLKSLKEENIKYNDSLLKTCLNLCKVYSDHMAEEYNMSIEMADEKEKSLILKRDHEVKKVFRNIVLLTMDNDLKLESLSSNIPAKKVWEFIYWLKYN